MSKYHINPETGNPGQCTARAGQCPYGANAPHFSTATDARMAYEVSQGGAWSVASETLPRVAEEVWWRDYGELNYTVPELRHPDLDFGFNWTVKGRKELARVSLARPVDGEVGVLYVHHHASSEGAILARDISEVQMEDLWQELLEKSNYPAVEDLHRLLQDRYS